MNNTWKEAFYEGERMIYENVMDFLLDIGCQPKWSFAESGEYIFINKVTYEGKEYDHDPSHNIEYELPAGLIEKLNAKFGMAAP
jgi:hypothetical protein